MARKNGVKYLSNVNLDEDNYFDAVTAFELIEHLFDQTIFWMKFTGF